MYICDKCKKENIKVYRLILCENYDGICDENGKFKKEEYYCEECSHKKLEELKLKYNNIPTWEEIFISKQK